MLDETGTEAVVGFQFIHLETFGRKADKAGRSTSFVLAEAARDPVACQHVATPAPPVVVFGATAAEVAERHNALAGAAMTSAAGRAKRIRQDQHTLATIVASHPATWGEVRANPAMAEAVAEWERRTVAWLRDRYGAALVSVLRHEDEAHPHLHAYLLPASDPAVRAKALHPGWAAKSAAGDAARASGADAKTANAIGDTAYKTAMRGWQDNYWHAVGLPCGLTRRGPGRRRLTRAQWQAERAAAADAAAVRRQADHARQRAQRADAHVRARLEALAGAEAAARAGVEEAERHRRDLTARARQQARGILGAARVEAQQLVTEAEGQANRLRGFGHLLGGLWVGLRGVEARLNRQADARVAAARTLATAEVAKAKEQARRDLRAEMGSQLDDATHAARRAERQLAEARDRLTRAEEMATAMRGELVAERHRRAEAERGRERVRSRWAEAENRLEAMQPQAAAPISRR